jgi:hypothetical protein
VRFLLKGDVRHFLELPHPPAERLCSGVALLRGRERPAVDDGLHRIGILQFVDSGDSGI